MTGSGRASPPTARVVTVLDFLARHPHDQFGLSELARRLNLSKPTCLGILTTLTDSGYLIRDAKDKTYRLGPALISLGHVAEEALRVNPAERAVLRTLSHDSDTTVALSAIVDDRITLLEVVAPTRVRHTVQVGQSYPFAPPVGLMFVLWDDSALKNWLARPPTIPLRTDSRRLDRVITECRAAGYLALLVGELISDIGERDYLRSEATGGTARHQVSVISAPVFDHHSRQSMVVTLQIGRALTDAEIVRYASGLMAAAAALTAQLGGVAPQARSTDGGQRERQHRRDAGLP